MYPQNWLQLLVVIAAVVPGFVYQISRRRVRGPGPDEQSVSIRVLRSIATSIIFLCIYIVVFGVPPAGLSWNGQDLPTDWRLVAASVLVLALLVPWTAAHVVFYVTTSKLVESLAAGIAARLKFQRRWDPTPSAWDFAFGNRSVGWVRVQTPEGDWIGGYFGTSSFASSYPDPREIYLETGYAMESDGTFGNVVSAPGGIYIRCDDARLVDFIPDQSDRSVLPDDRLPTNK